MLLKTIYVYLLFKNRMDAKQEVNKRTLQITGICTRIHTRQYPVAQGLRQIATITTEIDHHIKDIKESNAREKRKLATKNKELAKQNYELKQQLKETQTKLRIAEELKKGT